MSNLFSDPGALNRRYAPEFPRTTSTDPGAYGRRYAAPKAPVFADYGTRFKLAEKVYSGMTSLQAEDYVISEVTVPALRERPGRDNRSMESWTIMNVAGIAHATNFVSTLLNESR